MLKKFKKKIINKSKNSNRSHSHLDKFMNTMLNKDLK